MPSTVNIQNSILGLVTLGENVFIDDLVNQQDGIYYTKIFQKNSNDVWHRLAWESNQTSKTISNMKIEVRTRTGNLLPIKDYVTNTRYTLDEINNVIQTQSISNIDTILERATLNRSSISSTYSPQVDSSIKPFSSLGTSTNSFRLASKEDATWNYWSLPIINSPSYIPQNQDDNYLQARIYLQSNDLVNIPKMFRINFTSILKNSFTKNLSASN